MFQCLLKRILLCSGIVASVIFAQEAPPRVTGPVKAGADPVLGARLSLAGPHTAAPGHMSIWVHPNAPLLSMVAVADTRAERLNLYDLRGQELGSYEVHRPGMVDIRYAFPMPDGKKIDILMVSQLGKGHRLHIYAIDPATRKLKRMDDHKFFVGTHRGSCLFHDLRTGKFYAFITTDAGEVKQFAIGVNSEGKLIKQGGSIRDYRLPGACGAVLADDETGNLYVVEKKRYVWLFGAAPDSRAKGRAVIVAGQHGLDPEIHGLALYQRIGGRGYLLVSSQGNSSFRLYERQSYRYLSGFQVRNAVNPAGLAISSVDFAPIHPHGLFVCSAQASGNRPMALGLPFQLISELTRQALPINTGWDPRKLEFIQPTPNP